MFVCTFTRLPASIVSISVPVISDHSFFVLVQPNSRPENYRKITWEKGVKCSRWVMVVGDVCPPWAFVLTVRCWHKHQLQNTHTYQLHIIFISFADRLENISGRLFVFCAFGRPSNQRSISLFVLGTLHANKGVVCCSSLTWLFSLSRALGWFETSFWRRCWTFSHYLE